MSDNDALLKQAEGFAGLRRVVMMINALSYVVWIGATGLLRAGGVVMDTGALTVAEAVAFPIWLISLFVLLWMIARLAKRRDIGVLIDDERTVKLTARSFQVGYWALLIATAAGFALTYLFEVDARLILPLMLGLGVSAPSMTYALLYRS